MVVVSELLRSSQMSEQSNSQVIAWAFYNKDGSLRFIIDDEQRMKAWKNAHDGTIVPLVPQTKNTV